MSLRVAVVGARGRLGGFACGLIHSNAAFELVARLDSEHDLEAELRRSRPVVALDATRAGLGFDHASRMLALGVRPLVGTSGVSLEETRALDEAARARGLGGLVVPNFSLGMWLLQRAAVEAARHFARVEIVEMHHEKKKDAPSGTALDTAERLRAARGASAADPAIPIHSVRLPGMYAHQVVTFGAEGEVYTLRHDMHGPAAFGPGIVCGLLYASVAVGVGRGIEPAFERAEQARR